MISAIERRAQEFGKAVHLMCQFHLEGRLDEDTLDDNLRGPLEALKKWREEKDIIEGIVDIKTRPFDPIKDPLQLAGYALLWRGFGKPSGAFIEKPMFSKRHKLSGTPDILVAQEGATELKRRYVLELRQDGTYEYTNAHRPQDDTMFKSMLDNWHTNAAFQNKLNGWRRSV